MGLNVSTTNKISPTDFQARPPGAGKITTGECHHDEEMPSQISPYQDQTLP